MGTHDALRWDSARARALIADRDVGGAVRPARRVDGWRQSDLGNAAGYSASMISRLETGRRGSSDVNTPHGHRTTRRTIALCMKQLPPDPVQGLSHGEVNAPVHRALRPSALSTPHH
ncbi:MAG: helix-turn-helix domain-containing protein [Pseudonocardiaceae bacterium]